MLARENQHELCVLARKFGNLMIFGCWWLLNNPSLVEEITRMRVELLGTSFIPQHSDARVLEQLVYKWDHSRTIIGRVLADKYADLAAAGWVASEAEIRRDVKLMLDGNARAMTEPRVRSGNSTRWLDVAPPSVSTRDDNVATALEDSSPGPISLLGRVAAEQASQAVEAISRGHKIALVPLAAGAGRGKIRRDDRPGHQRHPGRGLGPHAQLRQPLRRPLRPRSTGTPEHQRIPSMSDDVDQFASSHWSGYPAVRRPQGRTESGARDLHGRVRPARGPRDRGGRAGYARDRLPRLLRQSIRGAAAARRSRGIRTSGRCWPSGSAANTRSRSSWRIASANRAGRPSGSSSSRAAARSPASRRAKQIWPASATSSRKSPRVEMTLADLVVGSECGGSDFTSGIAGNPAVGRVFDRLVDAGGTAVFEEVVEMIGLRDVLVDRAANAAARDEIAAAYDKAVDYCQSVRQYSISPGNFAGGLTTIEEKSLGALAKSGSRPIQGVIKVGQSPPSPGLWLLGHRARPALHAVRLHESRTTPKGSWISFRSAAKFCCSSPGAAA